MPPSLTKTIFFYSAALFGFLRRGGLVHLYSCSLSLEPSYPKLEEHYIFGTFSRLLNINV